MKQDALHHIERYNDSNKIYLDASKSTEGASRVTAAFYIEGLEWGHAARLHSSASIHAAELHAIHMAVNWLLQHDKGKKTTILSDSLEATQSLQYKSSLLLSIDKLVSTNICLDTASHVDIRGNKQADSSSAQN